MWNREKTQNLREKIILKLKKTSPQTTRIKITVKGTKTGPETNKGSLGTDPSGLRTLAATGLEKGTVTGQERGETDLGTEEIAPRIEETGPEIEQAGGTDQGSEETDPETEGHEAGREPGTGEGTALTPVREVAAAVVAAAEAIKLITFTVSYLKLLTLVMVTPNISFDTFSTIIIAILS